MIGEWSTVLGHELLAAEGIDDESYRVLHLPWHIAAQHQAFAAAIAMCYWSYKTDGHDDPWSFRHLAERGLLRYNMKNE